MRRLTRGLRSGTSAALLALGGCGASSPSRDPAEPAARPAPDCTTQEADVGAAANFYVRDAEIVTRNMLIVEQGPIQRALNGWLEIAMRLNRGAAGADPAVNARVMHLVARGAQLLRETMSELDRQLLPGTTVEQCRSIEAKLTELHGILTEMETQLSSANVQTSAIGLSGAIMDVTHGQAAARRATELVARLDRLRWAVANVDVAALRQWAVPQVPTGARLLEALDALEACRAGAPHARRTDGAPAAQPGPDPQPPAR
ncbi:MAG: hypothetical protein NZ898_13165 [Myxococcota bacterium]|nr:hypothetical protein [Myxococcota bacterium]MDW8363717.1 hypothetical protein [Myxococcales bacterium]